MKRVPIRAPASVIFYAKNMGGVDRLDKVVALADIRMRRCKKRYHRVIFFWFLSAIGFNNVKVIFEWLIGKENLLALRKKHRDMGYFHWFQDMLAEAIIEHFLSKAAKEAELYLPQSVSARLSAEKEGYCTSLHFMPASSRPKFPPSTPSAQPETHFHCRVEDIKIFNPKGEQVGALKRGRCVVCFDISKRNGLYDKEAKRYYMPGPERKVCPTPRHGCDKCKVVLCEDCFYTYDHKKNSTPETVRVSLFTQSPTHVTPPSQMAASTDARCVYVATP